MIIFHFFRFSISLVICSWTTTCRCVTTGMALYLSNQAESMCCLIYTCVAVRLLCIHKSLASAVCFDLWTGKSCCKLWLSHLYWSCWKCKCSPLSQLSMYDLFECEQMKVKKWECQNRCCHIYTMLASFHSLYIKKQSSDEDGRFPSTFLVVTLMLMNQATLRCGGHTNCDRATKTGWNEYVYKAPHAWNVILLFKSSWIVHFLQLRFKRKQ